MSHLGSRLSALVDGRLSPSATERVLAHVAGCPECADELAAARAARQALAGATDVPVAPDLTARLMALGAAPSAGDGADPGGPGQPAGDVPARGRSHGVFDGSVPLPGEEDDHAVPRWCLRGDVPTGRRVSRPLLIAAAGCVGAFVATLAVLGERPPVVPDTHPSYALTLLAQAVPAGTSGGDVVVGTAALGDAPAVGPGEVVGDVDLSGPEAHRAVLRWMEEHGWASPVALPEGYRVTALRLHGEDRRELELDLTGPEGTLVVLQRHGRLQTEPLEGLPVVEVDGRTVHVVCTSPWHVAWQSGDTVVSVVSDNRSAAVHALVSAHPGTAYDDGVPARISRGWALLAGSWSP